MPTLGLHLAITVTRLRGGTPPPPPVFAQLPITWTDNSSIEDGYRVKYEPTSGGIQLQIELAANSTAATIDGLLFNTQYDIEVVAYNEVGESLALGPVAIYTPPPAAPTVCTATATGSTTATIGWTAPGTAPVTGYRIYRSPHGAGTWTAAGVVAAGVNSFGDTGLTASTQYDWRVVAYNSNSGVSQPDSETDPSNTATATTLSGGGAWYDLLDFSTTNTSNLLMGGRTRWGSPISLPAGTATKLRCKVSGFSSGNQVKLGLYNSSDALVGETAYAAVSSSGTYEYNLISPPVISAGDYRIAIIGWDNDGYLDSRYVGTGYYVEVPPGGWRSLVATLPSPSWTGTDTPALGVFVT